MAEQDAVDAQRRLVRGERVAVGARQPLRAPRDELVRLLVCARLRGIFLSANRKINGLRSAKNTKNAITITLVISIVIMMESIESPNTVSITFFL